MHFCYIIFALKIKCSNLKQVQQRVFKRRFKYESRLSTMCAVQYVTTCYLGLIRSSVNVMSKSQRCVKYGEVSTKVNANNCTNSVRSFAFKRELIIREKNVKRFSSVAGNEERAWTCDGKCEGRAEICEASPVCT